MCAVVLERSSSKGPDDLGETAEVLVRLRINPSRAGIRAERQCEGSDDLALIRFGRAFDRSRGHSVPPMAFVVQENDQVSGVLSFFPTIKLSRKVPVAGSCSIPSPIPQRPSAVSNPAERPGRQCGGHERHQHEQEQCAEGGRIDPFGGTLDSRAEKDCGTEGHPDGEDCD